MAASPQEPLTQLGEAAAQMHEMFLAYMQAGFTDQQALYLVGQAVKAMFAPPTAGGG
jgi:hypothetical protein